MWRICSDSEDEVEKEIDAAVKEKMEQLEAAGLIKKHTAAVDKEAIQTGIREWKKICKAEAAMCEYCEMAAVCEKVRTHKPIIWETRG